MTLRSRALWLSGTALAFVVGVWVGMHTVGDDLPKRTYATMDALVWRGAQASVAGRAEMALQSASASAPVPAAPKVDEALQPRAPFRHMPGFSNVHDQVRCSDADHCKWIHALDVPVPLVHAQAYYEHVLRQAGMDVKAAPDVVDGTGVTWQRLRGRGDGVHAQVSLRAVASELRTRVRVIWRTWPTDASKTSRGSP